MKIRLGRSAVAVSALLIVLLLVVAPSFADAVLYDNGPINGKVNSWTITNPFSVADSFTLTSASTIGSFSAGLWVLPGDTAKSLSWAITTGAPDFNGGTVLFSGSGNLNNVSLGAANYGYNLYTSTLSGLNVSLAAGTYYLELFNTSSALGGQVGWDWNYGASTAFVNVFGSTQLSSESFTIYGTTAATTPEPGTMLIFGTGVLGLLGAVRRRFSM
jgi:hypothetical protein